MFAIRLVRVGPAKQWKKYESTGTDKEDMASDDGVCCPSEFEGNDQELTEYLQSNTAFLMAMHNTAACSDTWSNCFFGVLNLFDSFCGLAFA